MKSIYLIGFMGAGKTTVGKALSEQLQLRVYDTDEEIVEHAGKSIQRIFSEDGEEHFRKLESSILKELPAENVIVATGGGIILSEENRRWMKKNGHVIFLHAESEEILKRIKDDTSRPLLTVDKQTVIFSLYDKRLPLYEETAHFRVETTGKTLAGIVGEVVNRLKMNE